MMMGEEVNKNCMLSMACQRMKNDEVILLGDFHLRSESGVANNGDIVSIDKEYNLCTSRVLSSEVSAKSRVFHVHLLPNQI